MPIRLTRTVKIILIVCIAAFVVQQAGDLWFGTNLLSWFALVPYGFIVDHRFWQIVTYAFLHGDPAHLFFNLLFLAFIGPELEGHWGRGKFLRFYFFCTVMAGFSYLMLVALIRGQAVGVPMVGSSGAIYGLLMAYGLIFGERVMLAMMLFPMKAKHFVWILAGIELLTSLFSGRGGLSSVAHLGGMAAGYAYLYGGAAWRVYRRNRADRVDLSRRDKRRRSAKHLKLVVNKKDFDRGDDDADEPPTWH